jgi:hypothetical protein
MEPVARERLEIEGTARVVRAVPRSNLVETTTI